MSPEKLDALAEAALAAYLRDQLADALEAANEPAMTELQAKAQEYANKADANPSPCYLGHIGCAAYDKGPCSDEELSAAGL